MYQKVLPTCLFPFIQGLKVMMRAQLDSVAGLLIVIPNHLHAILVCSGTGPARGYGPYIVVTRIDA